MKKIFSFPMLCLLLLAGTFNSCKKENDDEKSKTELLTSKTWMYDEYFRNYNLNSTTVSYKRGKSNNALDLSPNRVSYKADGTYSEITETGTTLTGTWSLINNETQVETINSQGTFVSTIVLLDNNNYYWSATVANGIYAKMIPQ